MKLTEKIILAKSYYGSSGFTSDRYAIEDKPFSELIKNLHEQGIEIKEEYSEKNVEYELMGNSGSVRKMKATVPLTTEFKDVGIYTSALYLRDGDTLELKLQNYDRVTVTPRPGVYGGPYGCDFGILCKLSFDNAGTSKNSVDLSVVDKVRKALEKTYLPIDQMSDDILKLIKAP